MSYPYSNIGKVVGALLYNPKLKHAVKYINDRHTIKATRHGKYDRRNNIVVVTVGLPNYQERKFIKLAKKAGESFPIKKIQFKSEAVKKRGVRHGGGNRPGT